MKKYITQTLLVLFIIIPNLLCIGQTNNSWEIKHEPEYLANVKSIKTIINPQTNELFSFIKEASKTTMYITNEKHELVGSKTWDKKILKNINLENTLFVDNQLHNITLAKNSLISQRINLETGESETVYYNLESEKEGLIAIVKQGDKLRIITQLRKTPLIRIYTYDGSEDLDVSSIPYSEESFLKSRVLFSLFNSLPVIIKPNLPVEITTSQYPIKVYPNENEITISLEFNHKTYSLRINLEKMTLQEYVNDANILKRNLASYVKFNSFIYKDIILQTISTKLGKEIQVYVKDLKTDELLKTYKVERGKSIDFMNADMRVNYGENGSRKLTISDQFIRKTTSLNGQISISAFQSGENVQLNLGGVTLQQGPVVTFGIAFGVVGAVIALSTTKMNAMNVMYNNYAYSNVASIKCLFDSEFNSIEGEIQENVFDLIKQDDKAFENLKCMSLVTSDNEIIVGRYDSEKDLYVLTAYPIKK